MQPFDALTIKAILIEAKPLLVNRKVDRVQQSGRDEVVLTLRSRGGFSHFLLSAHAAFGRLCLINLSPQSKRNNPPNFCMLLRKHLTGATLVGVEQLAGERIVDLFFSCLDEVGTPTHKVLTAEIMGRHSNLIFWDKSSQQILGASHVVTREMSRQREVLPGLKYVRPPAQDKPNIFVLSRKEFDSHFERLLAADSESEDQLLEQWLMSTFAGLGRHLSEELVAGIAESAPRSTAARDALWLKISEMCGDLAPKPALRADLVRYSVVSWWPDLGDSTVWKAFPSANDMVAEYFHRHELRERFQQLRDRLNGELKQEAEKLNSRIEAASKYFGNEAQQSDYKKFGDLVLAHIAEIQPGASELLCVDLYCPDGNEVKISLNPNLSASQNAQNYYRSFAKMRSREKSAGSAKAEAIARLAVVTERKAAVESATTIEALESLRDVITPARPASAVKNSQSAGKKKPKQRWLSMTSSDGWTIYMGRNRQENDQLLSQVAQPHDIWMHVLGQGGSHVLIKVPSTKQDPPMRTMQEAGQAAARLSKAAAGGKVQVIYTQCRYVRKLAKGKPGLVRYENEKMLEVDTAKPMPESLRRLFSTRH
jgi:predicted ribosome quality control (RQC) complex YloA/Tae2 family protein